MNYLRSLRPAALLLPLLIVLTSSCGSDSGGDGGPDPDDAGRSDAGRSDAGQGDAGRSDAGPGDAGPGDAGPGDAGPGDDAGEPESDAVTAIGLDYRHTCAVRGGAVYCFGDNRYGQLGHSEDLGVNAAHPTPRLVAGLEDGVTDLAVGNGFNCAVRNGAVLCWGRNHLGQLGRGTVDTDAHPTPAPVDGLAAGVTAVAAGSGHACAIQAGALECWGYNGGGALGHAATAVYGGPPQPTPLPADGLGSGVSAVAARYLHTCVVHDGDLECFGDNSAGQLGRDENFGMDEASNPTPGVVLAAADGPVRSVSLGEYFTCAVQGGGARCWGNNHWGQLGSTMSYGSGGRSVTPLDVIGHGSDVSLVAAGYSHGCALKAGVLSCWGDNGHFRAGHEGEDGPQPIAVSDLISPRIVASGLDHSCAVDAEGLKCWGNDNLGQLGRATVSGSPTARPGLVQFPPSSGASP